MGKISLGTSIIYDDTAGASAPEIKYKSHSLPVYTAGATSLNITIPSDTVEGDLLIVCMLARSLVTPPAGWTQAIKQSVNTANLQWLEVYYKMALSSDAGAILTFSQAISGRMAISVFASTCPAGGAAIENLAGLKSASIVAIPNVIALGSGRLCLIAHAVYSTLPTATVYYMYGNKWMILNMPILTENRIAISIAHINAGSRPLMTLAKDSEASDSASIAVIFKPI